MKTLSEISQTLRERREALSLSQKDMLMKIGMSQQQYQRIETGGDTRLTTLLRVLEGMDLELMLVPKNRTAEITRLLSEPSSGEFSAHPVHPSPTAEAGQSSQSKSRWNSVLKDLED